MAASCGGNLRAAKEPTITTVDDETTLDQAQAEVSTVVPVTAPSLSTAATLSTTPPLVNPANIYSEAGVGKFSANVTGAKQYVYVPSTLDGSITVIDQATMKVVDRYNTGGQLVQHVVAGYDMRSLYANVSGSNFLFEIDPVTARPTGKKVSVSAPYNLYWTPDGTRAIVMAERLDRIDFYDRATWTKIKSTTVPCRSQVKGTNYGGGSSIRFICPTLDEQR